MSGITGKYERFKLGRLLQEISIQVQYLMAEAWDAFDMQYDVESA